MVKQVNISDELYAQLEKKVDGSNEFSSIDEYVKFVISEVLEINQEKSLSKDDEEKIEKHLKDMGYI